MEEYDIAEGKYPLRDYVVWCPTWGQTYQTAQRVKGASPSLVAQGWAWQFDSWIDPAPIAHGNAVAVTVQDVQTLKITHWVVTGKIRREYEAIPETSD